MKRLSFYALIILTIISSKIILSVVDIIFILVIIGLCYYSYKFIKIEAVKIYKKY